MSRHPIAAATTDADAGAVVVVCDDGAVFELRWKDGGAYWHEIPAVPGTPAEQPDLDAAIDDLRAEARHD